MPRRDSPYHSYFDSVITQLELCVGCQCSGVVSNVESNAASGVFLGLNALNTGLKAGMASPLRWAICIMIPTRSYTSISKEATSRSRENGPSK